MNIFILLGRQSHKAFFEKSDLFFVCMLRPLSFDIHKQDLEIEAAQACLCRSFFYFFIFYREFVCKSYFISWISFSCYRDAIFCVMPCLPVSVH